MARQPNAVDFWRGFALITIFIDHIPGLVYAKYTLVNFSISDAADLFVFLAGWSLRLMADGGGRTMPTRNVVLRLFGRADRKGAGPSPSALSRQPPRPLHGTPQEHKKRKPTVMTGISVRKQAVADIAAAPVTPFVGYKELPEALFGSNVFGLAAMKAHLPKEVFRSLKKTIEKGETLSIERDE